MADELDLTPPWSAREEDRVDVHILNASGEMIGWVAGRDGFPSALVARAMCAVANACEMGVPIEDALLAIAERGKA